jgi:hypothetical protein
LTEDSPWLCPIEDLRSLGSQRKLGSYLLLIDYTGRLFRKGKAAMSRELAVIFARVGTTADTWQAKLEALRNGRVHLLALSCPRSFLALGREASPS